MPRNGDETNGDVDSGHRRVADDDVELSVDAIFAVLADAERRVILEILSDRSDNTIGMDALINQLVSRKTDSTGELPSPDSIETRLHHVHLPKLTEIGVVSYDVQTGELRYWGNDRLEQWLERAQAEE